MISMPKLKQSGLLFVPTKFHTAKFMRWLKRIHAWTGFWGAILFLMLGISGFFLNHRDVMKIDTGEPVEVSAMDIAVPAGSIKDQEALGVWAKAELGLISEPREPRGKGGKGGKGGGGKDGAKEAGKKSFLGKERPEPEKWEMNFNHPNGRISVEYVKGSSSVSVRQSDHNILNFIKNLHKSGGIGIAWVLFMDSIAGALIAMSLTGFLLWTRMHGTRLAAGGIAMGSLAVATWAVWPYLL